MAHILPDPRAWDFRMASPPPQCPHGVPYAQRCNGCGWVCPTCKRSYAPWVRECNYSHDEDRPTAPPVLPAWCADPRSLSLRLPDEWTGAGYQRFVRACGEWREVTPGLQVLLGQPVKAGEEAILHFRLTPEGAA